jgi:hypothetical protein
LLVIDYDRAGASPEVATEGGAIVLPELGSKEADDRVLPLTRGIAAAIVPFLVVAFAVL